MLWGILALIMGIRILPMIAVEKRSSHLVDAGSRRNSTCYGSRVGRLFASRLLPIDICSKWRTVFTTVIGNGFLHP